MPLVRPISALCFRRSNGRDISKWIAPPYDVLDEGAKARLLATCPDNIVEIDLPHLPPKTVGPEETYARAGRTLRRWQETGVVQRLDKPALFAYRQTFTSPGTATPLKRLGLIANVGIQPFGPSPEGLGGIHRHEQTFSAPKEDRLKLTVATEAQLSPIFGLYNDADEQVHQLLRRATEPSPTFYGRTATDGVLHEVWTIDQPDAAASFVSAVHGKDIYIADGHHRYNTALNYRSQLAEQHGAIPPDHPASFCMFVLVAFQDPGMIVLPTHRVLGGMPKFTLDRFAAAARGKLEIRPFTGCPPGTSHGSNETAMTALAASLPALGPHAIGLYDPANSNAPLAVATTSQPDPLAADRADQCEAWRQLDVVIVQQLIVESICQPNFCPPGGQVEWKFTHTLEDLKATADTSGHQLGLIMQPTPLESVRKVSEAGKLMPPKSTFFYPKVATGLVIYPFADSPR